MTLQGFEENQSLQLGCSNLGDRFLDSHACKPGPIHHIHSIRVSKVLSYQHQSLIPIFEEGEILEFNQPDWNVVLIDEEACEQHEWNDKHRSQSNSQLLVGEDSGYDKCIASSSAVYKY